MNSETVYRDDHFFSYNRVFLPITLHILRTCGKRFSIMNIGEDYSFLSLARGKCAVQNALPRVFAMLRIRGLP